MEKNENEEAAFISTVEQFELEVEDKKEPDSKYTSILTLIAICNMSFLVGLNNTSFAHIIEISLNMYSSQYFPEHHPLLAKLPPIFYHIGGLISAIVSYNIKKVDFKKILKFSCALLLIAYCLTIAYPHILVIYLTRILIGFATGCMCIIIPQILHKMAEGTGKSAQLMTIFPFSLMSGLTMAVAWGLITTSTNYIYINLIPIILSALGFFSLNHTIPLKVQIKDKKKQSLWSFMYNSLSVRSFLHIIMLHFFSKTTGIDILVFFSSDLFKGKHSKFFSLLPLVLATLFTLTGGFVPDRLGRKIPFVLGLLGIAVLHLLIYFIGPNIFIFLLFMVFFFSGLNSVPFISQNEVVPEEFKTTANELGGIVSWLLGFLMTAFVSLMLTKQSLNVWLIVFCLTLIGLVLVVILMKETNGLQQTDFITKFLNYDSWYKAREIKVDEAI
ncbi:putative quinate permease [Nosema granulosis]|uniref:Quinate permease n=1 Tax=Nosema granulosis TaxID=83296 RepID=A0A9P6GYF0_9MICR|nr:putative quinate permease [Nosema granulosis]